MQHSDSGISFPKRAGSSISLLSPGSHASFSVPSISHMFRKFEKGVSGERHANGDQDIMSEEVGDWRYLVVDTHGIRPRDDASYCKGTRGAEKPSKLREGAIVTVDKRRKAGWTNWLGLSSGEGWVFDVSPKDKKVRMVEVEVGCGEWLYQAGNERVPILSLPSPQQATAASKSFLHAKYVNPGQTVDILKRVRPVTSKGSFLMLSNASGWVLDFQDGRQMLQRAGSYHDGTYHRELESCDQPVPAFTRAAQLGAPEFGEWDYIVVDPSGQTLRSEPSCDSKMKTARKLLNGEIVTVTERRQGDGTQFLRSVSPPGWLFDWQPAASGRARVRLTVVDIERGNWHYVVLAERGIALRSRCSFAEDSKVGTGPAMGSLVAVTERMKVGETIFLHLTDGHWIFDRKNGRQLMHGPLRTQFPTRSTMGSVKPEASVTLLSSPTCQRSAATKMVLLPGARVNLHMLCEIDGQRWAQVSKGWFSAEERGACMEGWMLCDQVTFDDPPASPASAADDKPRRVYSTQEVRAAFGAVDPKGH